MITRRHFLTRIAAGHLPFAVTPAAEIRSAEGETLS